MTSVPAPSTRSATKRVLLVDDDRSVLMSLPEVLATADLVVEVAASLDEARAILDRERFDLVVTDLCLRSQDDNEGLELIAWARDRYADTKLVVLTGYATPRTRYEALRLGAADYWTKSLGMESLLERLRALI